MSKKIIEYFPHDYHARHDSKMIKMQSHLGMVGVGVFWCIVESLYEEGGMIDADYEQLSYSLRADLAAVKSVCEDFDLFIISEGKITSKSVQDRLAFRAEKSEKARASVTQRWDAKKPQNTNDKKNDTNVSKTNTNVSKNNTKHTESGYECNTIKGKLNININTNTKREENNIQDQQPEELPLADASVFFDSFMNSEIQIPGSSEAADQLDNKNNQHKKTKVGCLDVGDSEFESLSWDGEPIQKLKITKDEFKKLLDRYNESDVLKTAFALDDYKGLSKYKSHYRTLLKWLQMAEDRGTIKRKDQALAVSFDANEKSETFLNLQKKSLELSEKYGIVTSGLKQ